MNKTISKLINPVNYVVDFHNDLNKNTSHFFHVGLIAFLTLCLAGDLPFGFFFNWMGIILLSFVVYTMFMMYITPFKSYKEYLSPIDKSIILSQIHDSFLSYFDHLKERTWTIIGVQILNASYVIATAQAGLYLHMIIGLCLITFSLLLMVKINKFVYDTLKIIQ